LLNQRAYYPKSLSEKNSIISDNIKVNTMSQIIQHKVLSRIYGKGRGWVFTPNIFLELGSRSAVDKSLQRLEDAGTIRRVARGLYDYPKRHKKLGILSPQPDAIARAVSRSAATRLQPSGAYAVNLLGLSQQVPAKIVYLTDGAEKTVVVGKQEIRLKRTTPKNMKTAGRVSGVVIQAFRYLKKDSVDSAVIDQLCRTLSDADKAQLWNDRVYAPAWMHSHFQAITQNGNMD
jgi:predicted transcriptional regulator of viral defense system